MNSNLGFTSLDEIPSFGINNNNNKNKSKGSQNKLKDNNYMHPSTLPKSKLLNNMKNKIKKLESFEPMDDDNDKNNFKPLNMHEKDEMSVNRMNDYNNGNSKGNINSNNNDNDNDDNSVKPETFNTLNSSYSIDYYKQYSPFSKDEKNLNTSLKKDELLEKLNYMIHLLEEQQDNKTGTATEEIILYSFLGIFMIFVIDSFARAAKYVR